MADSDKAERKAERLRKRRILRSRFSFGHPAWAVFAFAALVSIVFIAVDARGVLAAGDEWDYFHRLATRPLPEALFNAPVDKYLIAVPLLTIYLPQAEIFGIGETLPLRLAGIGLVVACLQSGMGEKRCEWRQGFAALGVRRIACNNAPPSQPFPRREGRARLGGGRGRTGVRFRGNCVSVSPRSV